jgi:MFS family permease
VNRFGIHVNEVIKYVFFTNSAYSFGHGLVMPFLAVFASTKIEGGTITVAGIASGIFLFCIGIAQLVGGRILDIVTRDEKRGAGRLFFVFSIRYLFTAIIFSTLLVVANPWQLYLNQAILGVSIGATQPFMNVIQTNYMDKGKEGVEWGINGFIFHICAGISAFLASIIIKQFGFSTAFMLGSVLNFIAFLFALKTFQKYKKHLPHKTPKPG